MEARDSSNDCRNCRRKGLRCSMCKTLPYDARNDAQHLPHAIFNKAPDIKADQAHPACQQCLQRGLHCRPLVSRGGPSAWRIGNPPNTAATTQAPESSSTFVPAGSAFHGVHSASEGGTTLATPGNELARVVTPPAPVTLDMAGFRDSIEGAWLYQHYTHRPPLQQILVASSSRSFGAAAVAAATAISATLFAKFHGLPLLQQSKPLQSPYCSEYASAVQALSKQVTLFKLSNLEEVLVPALLLLISEVRRPACYLQSIANHSF